MHSEAIFVGGSVLLALLFYRRWRLRKLAKSRLPPGPRPLPIIGNIKDIPESFQWLTYGDWAKQYGDVVHVEAFGNRIILLDSLKATTDLFEHRSSIYSDRPRMPMVKELMGWGWNFGFMSYGPQWRRYRRVFHQHFRPAETETYQPSQTLETRRMLRRFLETPEDYRHHIRHMTAATIMRITYGIEIRDSDDPYIVAAQEAAESIVEAAQPGAFLVDIMPILKHVPAWIPGASFQKKARHWRAISRTFVEKPFAAVKAAMASGNASPSFAATLLEKIEGNASTAGDEEVAKHVTGIAYGAAVDTISNTLYTFFLAMLLYPEVQKRAQAELDAVVGRERLPKFSDKPGLPYIDAVVKEILRWSPVLPLGVAHASIRDDEYNGHYIPKGSIVMGNAWSILHDEGTYPEPLEYRPERFLKDGKPDTAVLSPDAAFGFGRRICPGRSFAVNGIYIAVASILAVFDISPAKDASGISAAVQSEWISGLLLYPKPFLCTLTPRSGATTGLIRRALEDPVC